MFNQSRLHRESATSEMTRFHHDDQDENRLSYSDLFRRLVELQNETSHRQTILSADLNEEGPINQTETF